MPSSILSALLDELTPLARRALDLRCGRTPDIAVSASTYRIEYELIP